jgi:hypothetical protein
MKLKVFAGVDESNHGMYPEVFTAVFSKSRNDIVPFPKPLPKLRNLKKINPQVHKTDFLGRDYSFLLATEQSYLNVHRNFLIGKIISSLLGENWGKEFGGKLELLVDGELNTPQITNSKSIIKEFCGLSYSQISINSGARFDTTYLLVNLSDQLAYYFYKNYKGKFEQLEHHPKIKKLVI